MPAAASASAPVDRLFHALGDPTRRALIERLCESPGPVPASHLATPLAISLAAVVQHLQVLEQSGLVETEKVGRTRQCRIRRAGLQAVEDWVRERRAQWERRLDRLAELVEGREVGMPESRRDPEL